MDKVLIDKLTAFISSGEKAAAGSDFDAWRRRVSTFLLTALGADEAKKFDGLHATYTSESRALKLGYLEGLIAKAQATPDVPTAIITPPPSVVEPQTDARKVFLVHGHDNEAKETAARFLEKLGLEIIILHEQPNEGRTIIEKFENYSRDVAYAVVLLTPDDVGNAKDASSNLNRRARQNVIMELGYFMGKLGRDRVCALYKGNVELPSDYQGVLYLDMEDSGWKAKVAQELVQSKVPIDVQALLTVLG
jgi:predicted nucleotide-binding protein